jgi:2-phosphosulfolactate phosphatase
LQLNIFFNPAELSYVEAAANDIYIVIDVMRATTTMTVMFDSGARKVLAAQTLEQAKESAEKIPGRMLCGERHTKTPPGFDYGNSPAQFAQLDLSHRELILTTSNGTRALFACPEHSVRLAGCFYNAQAVTDLALEMASKQKSNISIVCAAEYGYFALEDSTCAGYMALELQRQHQGLGCPDNVQAAITLYKSYPMTKLLECAQSARDLKAVGQERDLDYCLHKNASRCVGVVSGTEEETGLLVLEKVC